MGESQLIVQKESLKLMLLNAENFFIFMDKYKNQDLEKMSESEWQSLSSASTSNKNLRKIWKIAELILEENPDILCLNEIGGLESLVNFNKYFLKNHYSPLLLEGNSNRGIDVGYLIKNDSSIKTVQISHKNRPINFLYPHEIEKNSSRTSHYFSRDVSELRLFNQDSGSPQLVILLTHLKSKLDLDGWDFQGKGRREAELKTLVKIYNEIQSELKNKVPILIAGDFNGIAHKANFESEFKEIYDQTDLVELFDFLNFTDEQRCTQVQFSRDGSRHLLQLDYFFTSTSALNLIISEQCGVHRYKDQMNQELPLSRSLDERQQLPSDHFPLILTIKNPLKNKKG